MTHLYKKLLLVALLFTPQAAWANWTLNLGYHNPLNAQIGLNFLRMGSNWGFEVGIGWVDMDTIDTDKDNDRTSGNNTNTTEDDTARAAIAGEIDLKYFFGSGGFRPFLQGGMGAAVAAEVGKHLDAGAGLGGAFLGGGLLMGTPKFYGYVSASVINDVIVQGGIGFDI